MSLESTKADTFDSLILAALILSFKIGYTLWDTRYLEILYWFTWSVRENCGLINTYSMNTYVLLHFEHKMTSQLLLSFCILLRAAGE